MKGWGIALIVFGAGSFVLPLMGIQFRLMSIMGGAVAMAVLGVVLLVVGIRQDQQSQSGPPPA